MPYAKGILYLGTFENFSNFGSIREILSSRNQRYIHFRENYGSRK
jgi:hypothetical protein